jgi:hypothetical protein
VTAAAEGHIRLAINDAVADVTTDRPATLDALTDQTIEVRGGWVMT